MSRTGYSAKTEKSGQGMSETIPTDAATKLEAREDDETQEEVVYHRRRRDARVEM